MGIAILPGRITRTVCRVLTCQSCFWSLLIRDVTLQRMQPLSCGLSIACVHGRQGLKKGHWSQLRFHGDDMLRPAASNEIAWLAVVLVRLSMWINRALGLDRPPDEDAHPDNIFQVGAACCPGSCRACALF